jgi:hypothetical protein
LIHGYRAFAFADSHQTNLSDRQKARVEEISFLLFEGVDAGVGLENVVDVVVANADIAGAFDQIDYDVEYLTD